MRQPRARDQRQPGTRTVLILEKQRFQMARGRLALRYGQSRFIAQTNQLIVAPQRGHKPKLVIGIAVVDQRSHAAQTPHAVVRNIRAGRLQAVVAAVAVHAREVREFLGVAAEADLIVGLVKGAEGAEELGFVFALAMLVLGMGTPSIAQVAWWPPRT